MRSDRERTTRGATIVVVLWALVALSALSLAAVSGAILDIRLAVRHREHSAALAAAEAGLAEGLAAVWMNPARAGQIDSLSGSADGSWTVRWSPLGAGLRLVSTGRQGSAFRQIEVRAEPGPGAVWRVTGWREIR